MASVLRDNGHLIVRAFCPPEPQLSPEDVVRKAENRELSNFHEFKLLLLAALQQGKACTGVELASVWRSFHAHFPDVNHVCPSNSLACQHHTHHRSLQEQQHLQLLSQRRCCAFASAKPTHGVQGPA
jgi:hypothetical protein